LKKLILKLMACVSLLVLLGASVTACGAEPQTIIPTKSGVIGQYTQANGDTMLLGNPDFYQIQNSEGETVDEGKWTINTMGKIVLSGGKSTAEFGYREDGVLLGLGGIIQWSRQDSN